MVYAVLDLYIYRVLVQVSGERDQLYRLGQTE
jgi:hypothetical protein